MVSAEFDTKFQLVQRLREEAKVQFDLRSMDKVTDLIEHYFGIYANARIESLAKSFEKEGTPAGEYMAKHVRSFKETLVYRAESVEVQGIGQLQPPKIIVAEPRKHKPRKGKR
jgi:hypothetical protein